MNFTRLIFHLVKQFSAAISNVFRHFVKPTNLISTLTPYTKIQILKHMATEDYDPQRFLIVMDRFHICVDTLSFSLDKLRNENNAELKAVNKPIICTISRNKVQKLEAGDRPLNTTLSSEAIKSIYYITPNPKNLGGTNFSKFQQS